jgi:histidinol-phosphatase
MIKQRQELLTFALQLAKAAEVHILPYYQRCAVSLKADGTEVTDADRHAEAVMREMITHRFPTHAILGEEFGGSPTADAPQQWIIDPLDGTTWFSLGMPLFGTLIAFLEVQEPVLGVIHFPVLGETVYAGKQLGCWFQRGEAAPMQVRVSAGVPLHEAVVSASGVHGSDIYRGGGGSAYRLTPVLHQARKFRFCGDCMQHALVCRGNLHVAIDTVMQPWDVAALIPCIEEAGGIATTLTGQREGIVFGGSLLTSCDQALHNEVLRLLQADHVPPGEDTSRSSRA